MIGHSPPTPPSPASPGVDELFFRWHTLDPAALALPPGSAFSALWPADLPLAAPVAGDFPDVPLGTPGFIPLIGSGGGGQGGGIDFNLPPLDLPGVGPVPPFRLPPPVTPAAAGGRVPDTATALTPPTVRGEEEGEHAPEPGEIQPPPPPAPPSRAPRKKKKKRAPRASRKNQQSPPLPPAKKLRGPPRERG